jgi:tetratricopeptide (TPR) repeat protein
VWRKRLTPADLQLWQRNRETHFSGRKIRCKILLPMGARSGFFTVGDGGIHGMTSDTSGGDLAARVFISYSRSDMAFVDRLEPALVARGFEVMIDREQIYAFEDWWARLQSLINQADTVVFSLSPDWLSSKVCRREIEYAVSLNKRFAPIVCRAIDPTAAPTELSRLNFIFFNDEQQFTQSLDRLVEALQTDIDWIRKHTEYGEIARRWAEAGRSPNSGLLLRSHVLEDAERWVGSRPAGAPSPTEATQAFIAASRRAATRRRNILSGSLAAGLVVALGLAAWAWRERGIAIVEKELAQRNFDAAKSTVDSVVTDIAQGLRDVQGMRVDTVRRILGHAENAVNELAAATSNDPQVRDSQAEMDTLFSRTYLRLGATRLAASYADTGNVVARALVATQPDNNGWLHDLALNLHVVGDVREQQGDLTGALAAYKESLDILHSVVAKEPENALYRSNLAVSLNKVGRALADQNDLAGALAAYREQLGVEQKLAAEAPNDLNRQRDLSSCLSFVADLEARQGDLTSGLTDFQKSLAIARAIAAKDPDETEWQRDVSVTLGKIGQVLIAEGDQAGAIAAYREGLDMARALAAKDPGNTQWQADVAANLNVIGSLFFDQGDIGNALAAHREEIAIERKLAAADADDTDVRNNLQLALIALGEVQVAQGDGAGALASYEESLTIGRALVAKSGVNATWQRNLTISLTHVGDVLRSQNNHDGALASYREALDIERTLAAHDPSNAELQRDVPLSLDRIGDLLMDQNDQAGALAAANEGLARRKALAAKDPANREWEADVTYSLMRIGSVQLAQGSTADAIKTFQVVHDTCDHVAKADPDNAEWQYSLAVSFGKLSDGYNHSGENDKSMDAARQGQVIMERLMKLEPDNATWKAQQTFFERRIAFLVQHGQK